LVRGWILLAVLVVLCLTAGSAWGSFPGRNGKIVFGWTGESAYRAGPTATSIRDVDPRSGRVRVLRDCPLRTDAWRTFFTDCTVSAPRYSPDGRRIAFPTIQTVLDLRLQPPWQSRPGLGTIAPDGTALEEHATTRRYWALAWSPAGNRFLVQRGLGSVDPWPSSIFLASLDGTELSRVTPQWTEAPDWSSTGQVAFGRYSHLHCRPDCENIWVTRLGGTPRRLTYRGGNSPSWSPRGTKLAFVRARSRRGVVRRDIYIVRRDGRGLRRLTRRGGDSPSWSPDGRWIAFIRDGDIYVVRSTGGGLRRLVNVPPLDLEVPTVTSLDWQPLPRR
jgi:Tol biopolymer transport system component